MTESDICKNFIIENLDVNLNIGYSHTRVPFIMFPILSIILNSVVIVYSYIRKDKNSREKYMNII